MKFNYFLGAILLSLVVAMAGCASVAAGPPAPAAPPVQEQAGNDAGESEYMAIIVEQAMIIEALQAELMAYQESDASYGYVYEVEEGQSLWMIADNILGDPYRWMAIYTMNPWMGDPNLIYPYQILVMP